MAETIIGRAEEISLLEGKLSSNSAEFIVVYGRRRVGKTYLIKQFFNKQTGIYFEQTGLNNGNLQEQLTVFSQSLSKAFYRGVSLAVPKNWIEALEKLTVAIEETPKNKRITIFFDELPWLSTQKSGFIKALEHYWNTRWTDRKKLILIVCGSAASWMIENIIYAKGGLHNRITAKIPLQPLSIKETKFYLTSLGINLNHQQVMQIYMAIGGIPHYLKSIKKGLSATQNINDLCFKANGLLFNEFNILFHSLYEDPESYINIIRTIASKSQGMSRDELIEKSKMPSGGYLNSRLKSLEDAGFILTYLPVGHTKRGVHYRVIDEYSLFYLNWIEPLHNKNLSTARYSWEALVKKPAWNTWAGYTFESICYKHIDIIKKALRLEHIPAFCSNWLYRPNKGEGAQIDLVFDRDDGCITLCEIKYSEKPYLLSKDYAADLQKKEAIFNKVTRNKKQIFWVLIASNGAVSNNILKEQINKTIDLDNFFEF